MEGIVLYGQPPFDDFTPPAANPPPVYPQIYPVTYPGYPPGTPGCVQPPLNIVWTSAGPGVEDPEITAIHRILDAVKALPAEARPRVWAYVSERAKELTKP